MPNKPCHPYWDGVIRRLREAQPGIGPGPIKEVLDAAVARGDIDVGRFGPPPSERTIANRLRKFVQLPPEERRQYAPANWPNSFTTSALPWEAAPAFLECLAFALSRGFERPPNRLAYWFWRVSQAAPTLPDLNRYYAAELLALAESTDWDGRDRALASLELCLAFRPWDSAEAKELYNTVVPHDQRAIWLTSLVDMRAFPDGNAAKAFFDAKGNVS